MMSHIKNLLLGLMLAVTAADCSNVSSIGDGGTDTDADTDSDSDTGPAECNLGEYSGDFMIPTQLDFSALAGYTSISGDLNIGSPFCTDLSELICLESVGGTLTIAGNLALTNLNGLGALTSVGGDLRIGFMNDFLTNLDGLGALTSVGGSLSIISNDVLTSLDGLNTLTSVGEDLSIYNATAVTNLNGLSALTSVERLFINGNDVLPDCEVCDLLDQLTATPSQIGVQDNLDDTCTPVPTNCP